MKLSLLIKCKYLPATNHRGFRTKFTATYFADDPKSILEETHSNSSLEHEFGSCLTYDELVLAKVYSIVPKMERLTSFDFRTTEIMKIDLDKNTIGFVFERIS